MGKASIYGKGWVSMNEESVCCTFYKKLLGLNPYPHQETIWKRIASKDDDCLLTILRASVGSGKTESIILPSLNFGKRLIMIYPTKSLIDDQIRRIIMGTAANKMAPLSYNSESKKGLLEALVRMEGRSEKTYRAIVDTGEDSSFYEVTSNTLKCFKKNLLEEYDWSTQEYKEPKSLRHKYRPLYNADIILTTIDKFLYRFFGYGPKRWSYAFPYRIGAALKDVVVCFDEAHVYDSVAFTNFVRLINALVANGVKVVVMSATLSNAALTDAFPYLDLGIHVVEGFVPGGTRNLSWERELVGENRRNYIVDLLKKNKDKKRIVILNTVREAFAVFSKLQSLGENKENLFLYHGRLTPDKRSQQYNKLRHLDSMGLPYIVVTTNAIEVGCDLSADILITEFCNPDQLIQRIGRCARRLGETGQVRIVGQEVERFWHMDMVDYQKYLDILSGKQRYDSSFVEDIMIAVRSCPNFDDKVEILFDGLYDYVYNGRLENYPIHDSGFIVTRSWEPSVELSFVEDVNKLCIENPANISVNITSLADLDNKENRFKPTVLDPLVRQRRVLKELEFGQDYQVFLNLYNDRDEQESFVPLIEVEKSTGWLYNEHVLVQLNKATFRELGYDVDKVGLVTPIKIFKRSYNKSRQRAEVLIPKNPHQSNTAYFRLYYLSDRV